MKGRGHEVAGSQESIQQAPQCEVDSIWASVRNIRQKTFSQDKDQSVLVFHRHGFAAKDVP